MEQDLFDGKRFVFSRLHEAVCEAIKQDSSCRYVQVHEKPNNKVGWCWVVLKDRPNSSLAKGKKISWPNNIHYEYGWRDSRIYVELHLEKNMGNNCFGKLRKHLESLHMEEISFRDIGVIDSDRRIGFGSLDPYADTETIVGDILQVIGYCEDTFGDYLRDLTHKV
jgi:hypothetical protein